MAKLSNKKVIVLAIIVVLCIQLIAVGVVILSRFINNYSLLVSFENNDDIISFEKRLEALDMQILSSEETDRGIIYKVRTFLPVDREVFGFCADNIDVSIVDKNGDEVFNKDHVVSVKMDNITALELKLTPEQYPYFYEIYRTNFSLTFIVDGVEYKGAQFAEDGIIAFTPTPDYDETFLQKTALALSSADLKGKVVVDVLD